MEEEKQMDSNKAIGGRKGPLVPVHSSSNIEQGVFFLTPFSQKLHTFPTSVWGSQTWQLFGALSRSDGLDELTL